MESLPMILPRAALLTALLWCFTATAQAQPEELTWYYAVAPTENTVTLPEGYVACEQDQDQSAEFKIEGGSGRSVSLGVDTDEEPGFKVRVRKGSDCPNGEAENTLPPDIASIYPFLRFKENSKFYIDARQEEVEEVVWLVFEDEQEATQAQALLASTSFTTNTVGFLKQLEGEWETRDKYPAYRLKDALVSDNLNNLELIPGFSGDPDDDNIYNTYSADGTSYKNPKLTRKGWIISSNDLKKNSLWPESVLTTGAKSTSLVLDVPKYILIGMTGKCARSEKPDTQSECQDLGLILEDGQLAMNLDLDPSDINNFLTTAQNFTVLLKENFFYTYNGDKYTEIKQPMIINISVKRCEYFVRPVEDIYSEMEDALLAVDITSAQQNQYSSECQEQIKEAWLSTLKTDGSIVVELSGQELKPAMDIVKNFQQRRNGRWFLRVPKTPNPGRVSFKIIKQLGKNVKIVLSETSITITPYSRLIDPARVPHVEVGRIRNGKIEDTDQPIQSTGFEGIAIERANYLSFELEDHEAWEFRSLSTHVEYCTKDGNDNKDSTGKSDGKWLKLGPSGKLCLNPLRKADDLVLEARYSVNWKDLIGENAIKSSDNDSDPTQQKPAGKAPSAEKAPPQQQSEKRRETEPKSPQGASGESQPQGQSMHGRIYLGKLPLRLRLPAKEFRKALDMEEQASVYCAGSPGINPFGGIAGNQQPRQIVATSFSFRHASDPTSGSRKLYGAHLPSSQRSHHS